MRISDWSSDVCSSDLGNAGSGVTTLAKNDSGTWVLTGNHSYTGSTNINAGTLFIGGGGTTGSVVSSIFNNFGTLGFNRSNSLTYAGTIVGTGAVNQVGAGTTTPPGNNSRSDEQTSELQSLMRISYAVFCLKKKKK